MSLDPLRRWEQRINALPMPSPLVWAALIGTFLGFGVLIGRATPDSRAVLASQRAPLKLLVARTPTTVSPSTTPAEPPLPAQTETTPTPEPEAPEQTESSKGSPSTPASKPGSSSAGGSEGAPSGGAGATSGGKGNSKAKLSAIKHVFLVVLSDEPYATAFGPSSPAHYLTGTLEKKGELLLRYYAVAHEGLANEIALLSGQGPTEATAANCPTYTNIESASVGENGQVLGKGCVYPDSTGTLMGQLMAKRLTWKAYVQGIDEGAGSAAACAHPELGGADTTGSYASPSNPFVYFKSIAGSPACAANDLGISALKADLKSEKHTASFSYIAPGLCDDGTSTACVPGAASGMTAADGFLQKIVPQILSSKAYKKDGLLAITVDNAPSIGEFADSSSCCGEPHFPNLPAPTGAAALAGGGGGQVGLLLLSPFIKKGGGLVQDTYNHFSLLATIEQIFGLSKLGYAGLSEVKPLSPSLFSGG